MTQTICCPLLCGLDVMSSQLDRYQSGVFSAGWHLLGQDALGVFQWTLFFFGHPGMPSITVHNSCHLENPLRWQKWWHYSLFLSLSLTHTNSQALNLSCALSCISFLHSLFLSHLRYGIFKYSWTSGIIDAGHECFPWEGFCVLWVSFKQPVFPVGMKCQRVWKYVHKTEYVCVCPLRNKVLRDSLWDSICSHFSGIKQPRTSNWWKIHVHCCSGFLNQWEWRVEETEWKVMHTGTD